MDNYEVSVITPLYNSEKYISECINSVLAQSFQNWEMIIVDDCSTDDSVNNVLSFDDKRITLVKLDKNSGAGIARNKAIKLAQGKFIAFLDADDIWHPKKLEYQISFMKQENIYFSFTSYYTFDTEIGKPNNYIEALDMVSYDMMLKNNYIGCLTAVYNVEVLGKVYMPYYRKRQDWGLWLKLLEKTDYALSLKEPLSYYRVGNESLSKNKFKLLKSNFQFYNLNLGFSFFKSLLFMAIFIYHLFSYKLSHTKSINNN